MPPIFPKDELEQLAVDLEDSMGYRMRAATIRSAITAYEALAYSYSEAMERIERDSAALLSSRSDAERLDWLNEHCAHVEEFPSKGQFQVVVFNETGDDYVLAQNSKSPREAIDAAMAANRPSEEDDR